MKFRIVCGMMLGALLLVPVSAHDLFLKLDTYFLKPGDRVSIKVLNGSFMASEGVVTFARLADASTVRPDGQRARALESDFTKDNTTASLNLQAADAGTYVVGLSTLTRDSARRQGF